MGKKEPSIHNSGPLPAFTELVEIISETAKAVRPNAKHLLDMGCGGGHMAKAMMKLYPDSHFTLLDIHPGVLKRAANRTKGLTTVSPEFIEADIRTAVLPKSSYNVITAMYSFWFLNDAERVTVLRTLMLSLARRGCLLIGLQVGEDHPVVSNVIKERISRELEQSLQDRDRVDRLVTSYTKEVQHYTSAGMMHDLLIYAGFTAEVVLIYKRNASAVFLAIKP